VAVFRTQADLADILLTWGDVSVVMISYVPYQLHAGSPGSFRGWSVWVSW